MDFVWIMVIVLAIAQIEAICVSKHLLHLEEMYCVGCDWWVDGCTKIPFVMSFIPIVGLFTSIALSVDFARNIIRALSK